MRAALLLFALLTAAVPGRTFVDRTGDAGGGLDITHVTVISDQSAVVFVISTRGSWTNSAAILRIDTDNDPSTGNAFGERGWEAVYVLHSQHDRLTLERSNGVTDGSPAATWTLGSSRLTIRSPLSELQPGPKIGFSVEAAGPIGDDVAPDSGVWTLAPGARVTRIAAAFSARSPRAGRRFELTRVRTTFSDATKGTAPAKCAAKLGKKSLHGCRWRLGRRALGKRLAVVIAAAGLTRTYTFRVR